METNENVTEKVKKEFVPMSFREYSSLENTYRTKELDRIVEQGLSGGLWRVSCKIHGSNFSMWFDGNDFKCAKRSGFLGEGENFFSWKDIRLTEKPKVEKMFAYLQENKPAFVGEEPIVELVVYGELFGGNYPHPDVPRDPNATNVQKGVFYSPSNMFYGFDIKVNGRLLNEDTKTELFNKFEFFNDEPLFVGTFKECLEYPNLFQTTIPGRLGLPAIENNVCEGVVIKPVEVKRFWSGERVVLKNKNAKFAENTGKQSGEKIMKMPKEEIQFSEEGTRVLELLLGYVNENRLRAVISKIGQITDKMFGTLMGAMVNDVMVDFLKDYKQEFDALDVKEQKYLPKVAGKEVTLMIRSNFLNIVDGNY